MNTNPMKVLHVEAGKNLYGGALQVFYLLRALHEKGIENVLVCPEGSAIADAAAECAKVEACAMRGDLDIPFVFRLKNIIQRHKPDLIHVHSRRGADVWSAFAAKLTGTPAILTRRVDNPEPHWFAKMRCGWYQSVVAISEGIRQVLLSEGVAENHVQTIHSAVDTDKFKPGKGRVSFQQRFDLPCDAVTVGVVAQLIERKGHRFLFECLPELVAKFPQLHCLVLGKGSKEEELKALAKKLGLEKHVHFMGFQTDIEVILPELDIVVHPALMEGLGVALLQASACGVPIVGAAAGGIPEVVLNEKNGFLVPPADSAAIQSALTKLLESDYLRMQMGQRGRALVEEQFSIGRMAECNVANYECVLGVKPSER